MLSSMSSPAADALPADGAGCDRPAVGRGGRSQGSILVRRQARRTRAEFTLELDVLYDRIAQNPRQFPEIGDGARRALMRRFPYAVYFVTTEEAPVIIAVLHQHRRPEAWKQRL